MSTVTVSESFLRVAARAILEGRGRGRNYDDAWGELMHEARSRIVINLDQLSDTDLPPSADGCDRACWWSAIEWIRSQLRHGEL